MVRGMRIFLGGKMEEPSECSRQVSVDLQAALVLTDPIPG